MSLSTPLDKADANRDLASPTEDDGEKTPISIGLRGLGEGDWLDWVIAVIKYCVVFIPQIICSRVRCLKVA